MNKPIYIGQGKAFNEECFEVMKEMPNGLTGYKIYNDDAKRRTA